MTNIDDIKLAGDDIAFVRNKGEVVFPEYAARENLKLWYDFSGRTNTDAQKGVAEDLSGNGNNGTLNGFAYESGSGYEDGALKIDGIDDYIGTNVISVPEISICAVIMTNSSSNYPAIFSKRNNIYYAWELDIPQGEGRLELRINDNYNRAFCPTFLIKDKFYFLGISISGDEVTFFINNSYSIHTLPIGFRERIAPVNIGRRGYIGATEQWKGGVYNFLIYDRKLTQEEFSHNYEIDKKRFNITD